MRRGPHIAAWCPWPMSQITNIFGSDDDDEILESLYMIVNVSCCSVISFSCDRLGIHRTRQALV